MICTVWTITGLLGLAVILSGPVSASEPACEPPATGESHPAARIEAGHYRLTLVATTGKAKGQSATGNLDLWPTSASDRSPKTGQLAYGDIREQPLFGATDLDFHKINAAVTDDPTGLEPEPTSKDPVFPGVLVLRHGGSDVLLVSTLSNWRVANLWLDGSGIGLHVKRVSGSQVSGDWRNWGMVVGSGGYFCAERTGPPPPRVGDVAP